MTPALAVEVATNGPLATVTLAGEIDLLTAPQLQQAYASVATGYVDVAVDLSRVRFCDVVGLNALLAARRALTQRGCRLTYHNPPPRLTRLIALAGLTDELLSSPI